ncbi:MAG: hypothetical protein ABMA13_10910 [Chthoniobacteraceae bacterium]
MKKGLFEVIKRAFTRQPKLHPVEAGLAKRWIKQRLLVVFPELRNDPPALDRAYRSLGLSPRPGTEEGEPAAVFEMSLPSRD